MEESHVESLLGGRARSASDSDSSSGNIQFAQGKDNLRPPRNSNKNKSELLCTSFATTGSCTYGTKCRYIHYVPVEAKTTSTIKVEQANNTKEWSPADDGIEVRIPPQANNTKEWSSADDGIEVRIPPQANNTKEWSPADDGIEVRIPPQANNTKEWSPADAGIEVCIPTSSTPTTDEVNAYINKVLYGPSRPRRRLPVFQEICPDETD